jgi:DNA-binding response OmpR family regulator
MLQDVAVHGVRTSVVTHRPRWSHPPLRANAHLPSILVLGDSPEESLPLGRRLREAGFRVAVAPLSHFDRAIRELASDIVVLDLRVRRDFAAIEATVRPVTRLASTIVVTHANIDLADCLDAGADDAVTSAVSVPELCARIRVHHRRSAGRRAGCLRLDLREGSVWLGVHEVNLAPLEFRLLALLMSRPNLTITRSTAVQAVWGTSTPPCQSALDTLTFRLRAKLGAVPGGDFVHVSSVRGVGLRLDVVSVDARATAELENVL